ncbi:MAG: response regulator [Planctomycetota bacterium]|jgi:DNA-binding NarL/FixJ family response regulator
MTEVKKECVILADSHQAALEGMRELLESKFDTIMMVADEESLFMAVGRTKPNLAIVDLSLNASSEVNIISRFHSLYPELKFIILSVNDDPLVSESVIEMGANGFVLKRSVATDLIEAIREVLQGRVYVSPFIKR